MTYKNPESMCSQPLMNTHNCIIAPFLEKTALASTSIKIDDGNASQATYVAHASQMCLCATT